MIKPRNHYNDNIQNVKCSSLYINIHSYRNTAKLLGSTNRRRSKENLKYIDIRVFKNFFQIVNTDKVDNNK